MQLSQVLLRFIIDRKQIEKSAPNRMMEIKFLKNKIDQCVRLVVEYITKHGISI